MFTLLLLLVFTINTNAFITTVPEGYSGIHSILGQVQPNLVSSLTTYLPIYSSVTLVKHVQDTDHVENTKCTSIEGVDLSVPDIEIANRIDRSKLIETIKKYGFDYDKKLVVKPLAQYMRELCAERTVDRIEITDFHKLDDLLREEIQRQNNLIDSGITIDYVRVTGIIVPHQIKEKRLKLAEEKANKLHAEEVMKRTEIEKTAEAYVSQRDNERKQKTKTSENEIMIQDSEALRRKRSIENAMSLEATQTEVQKIKLNAVANAEKMELEAKALRMLFDIPEYANVEKMKAISDNTEMIYWGNSLPHNAFVGMPGAPIITSMSK
jgi:regulator of protease activity HflC (stomatin/prohibitin superfamily)